MYNSYYKIDISLELLRAISLPNSDIPYILVVCVDNIKYEFLIRRRQSNKLLIMGNGAYDRTQTLPVFQRHSWMDDLDYSIIYYNDPTLYLGDLSIGWCCGDKDSHYILNIANIIKIISDKLLIDNNNIVFYGSSAGGFTSLMLATLFEDSIAIVNNPQISIPKFSKQHFEKLCDVCFPNEAYGDVLLKYDDRLNIVSFMKKEKYLPRIFYLQNIWCEHDMVTQYYPFIKDLQKKIVSVDINSFLETVFYFSEDLGHNPLPKDKTIFFIKKYMEK